MLLLANAKKVFSQILTSCEKYIQHVKLVKQVIEL